MTGSRHLLESEGGRILIDCGLFQGLKASREMNWAPFPVDPRRIDGVVLTHAHLDHSGYLPRLVQSGYAGEVVCSPGTADLAEILLRDAAKLQERDAERANRHGYTRHSPALPLYTVRQAERALKRVRTQPFSTEREVAAGARLRLLRAGHILGASIAELSWGGRKVVFSGDLGRYDDAVMKDPERVARADYLVVESTYGDRLHPPQDPADALLEVVQRTVARGGTVIIPSFAVGRAQLLLHHLWRLKRSGLLGLIPIYLDSPMAVDATALMVAHMGDHRLSPDECRASCHVAEYVRDVEASKALSANSMPKIIISASGMATGGRVLHHIRAFGGDPRNTILFSGYQAVGTRGAKLLAGQRDVRIFGQWFHVRAEIGDLPMLSAHADADEIMRWLSGFEAPPAQTFIVHGEPAASEALRDRISRELGWRSTVAVQSAAYSLP